MSYIVESGASSARRSRRRRALITLSLVVLMLFFAFWYAYSYYQDSSEPTSAPAPGCTTAAPAKAGLSPGDITVNVYNATSRSGLAAKTAADVASRGFNVATVANDPYGRRIAGAAEVRYGESGVARAKAVQALVKGAKAVRDGRNDSSVDLVLGEKFSALAKQAKPAPAPATPAC